jgi:hypothetical protein
MKASDMAAPERRIDDGIVPPRLPVRFVRRDEFRQVTPAAIMDIAYLSARNHEAAVARAGYAM